MSQQNQSMNTISERTSTLSATTRQMEQSFNEVAATAEMLRTQSDQISGLKRIFGFGKRILVPADEIHAVVGDGVHISSIAKHIRIYGKTADQASYYWLNPLTQVIKLKTVSFTVPIRGVDGEGVAALDNSNISFRLWAHAVAKLNPDKAEIAAQRVGVDTTSLLNTITKVGTAELIAATATMELADIIANRQRLAEIAFPKVNQILGELGYDLALLTITRMDGDAYRRLVKQAESRISKETSIATNREQVAEIHDDQARERTEAEIKAETDKKLAAERLDADREVEERTLSQKEVLAVRRHELQLHAVDREKIAAEAEHEVTLTRVQLGQKKARTEAENSAQLARLRAEREAELKALQQQRQAALWLAETQAEAEKMALHQQREIERKAALTQAEAERLRREELAAAERAKQVALVEAHQLAEAMELEAGAEAKALEIQTEASTKAELLKAEREATATEKRAQAAKLRAEATRAESAALGLAEAEVEAARVQVSEQQVTVTRAEGLARAEVAKAQAAAEAQRLERIKEVEINAQRQLMDLYEQAPVLVDLERLKMQMSHEERLMQMQMDAYLQAIAAIAPNMKVHIYGNGGQVSKIMTDVLSLAQGVGIVSEELPFLKRAISGNGLQGELPTDLAGLQLPEILPFLRDAISAVNPRVLAGMTVADLFAHLQSVVTGREDILEALDKLQADASFRVIGDLPVEPFLQMLGIGSAEAKSNGSAPDILPLAA